MLGPHIENENKQLASSLGSGAGARGLGQLFT